MGRDRPVRVQLMPSRETLCKSCSVWNPFVLHLRMVQPACGLHLAQGSCVQS